MDIQYDSLFESYSVTITGTILNNSGFNYSCVQIEYVVYDEFGYNLGTVLANINNLLSGDKYNFTAILLNVNAKNKPAKTVLHNITYW